MNKLTAILLLLSGSLHAVAAPTTSAAEQHYTFNSGSQRVDLLELYTSEGCSSCPPAEAWLGKLLERTDLWHSLVPVAFHVDYWDDLGWKDPFSTAGNSQRQRRYQAEGGVRSVYTPGFVLNGSEWRGWFSGQPLPTETTPSGLLSVDVTNGQISASYRSEKNTQEALELHVALLGFDLTTKIAGGENRGKSLTHQFVVLQHVSAVSDRNEWMLAVPEHLGDVKKRALAIWITQPDRQQPLQATGGWLQ